MFSAKGALHFYLSLGQRPRIYGTANAPVLKARFTSGTIRCIRRLKRAFSACLPGNLNSWGDAPGSHETMPLALSR
ncbi:MAG: hypothetical protein DMF07_10595 [Verrucomicrobia bacterium]|nr:MAG: hypothetical protein DMF07_10595 [Verrucomicrobiota bacterium]